MSVLTKREKDYCKSKLSAEDLNFHSFQKLKYRIKSLVDEGDLVECSRRDGTGKTSIREEWKTNCKKCDSGAPGPPGKHPKNWSTFI